jgi:hypothetical protein
MAGMERITIRLSRSDLATLDRLRGRTDRSTYLRRLLRRAGRLEEREPHDSEDDGNEIIVSAERFERLRPDGRRLRHSFRLFLGLCRCELS